MFELGKATWPEVEKLLRRTDLAILPIGSFEQHGTHLPLITDTFAAESWAKAAAKKAKVAALPPLTYGISPQHMGFPGTITVSNNTLSSLIIDIGNSLAKHGFKKLLILNSHGTNEQAINKGVESLNKGGSIAVKWLGVEILANILPDENFSALELHSGYYETSLILYLNKELVIIEKAEKPDLEIDEETIEQAKKAKHDPRIVDAVLKKFKNIKDVSKSGVVTLKDPGKAEKEVGQKIFNEIVEYTVKFIEKWE